MCVFNQTLLTYIFVLKKNGEREKLITISFDIELKPTDSRIKLFFNEKWRREKNLFSFLLLGFGLGLSVGYQRWFLLNAFLTFSLRVSFSLQLWRQAFVFCFIFTRNFVTSRRSRDFHSFCLSLGHERTNFNERMRYFLFRRCLSVRQSFFFIDLREFSSRFPDYHWHRRTVSRIELSMKIKTLEASRRFCQIVFFCATRERKEN